MSHYLIALYTGGALFMAGVIYCVYAILKLAHDEDPGCLNPNRH